MRINSWFWGLALVFVVHHMTIKAEQSAQCLIESRKLTMTVHDIDLDVSTFALEYELKTSSSRESRLVPIRFRCGVLHYDKTMNEAGEALPEKEWVYRPSRWFKAGPASDDAESSFLTADYLGSKALFRVLTTTIEHERVLGIKSCEELSTGKYRRLESKDHPMYGWIDNHRFGLKEYASLFIAPMCDSIDKKVTWCSDSYMQHAEIDRCGVLERPQDKEVCRIQFSHEIEGSRFTYYLHYTFQDVVEQTYRNWVLKKVTKRGEKDTVDMDMTKLRLKLARDESQSMKILGEQMTGKLGDSWVDCDKLSRLLRTMYESFGAGNELAVYFDTKLDIYQDTSESG